MGRETKSTLLPISDTDLMHVYVQTEDSFYACLLLNLFLEVVFSHFSGRLCHIMLIDGLIMVTGRFGSNDVSAPTKAIQC